MRYPMRSFPSDLSITANAGTVLASLEATVAKHFGGDDARVASRRKSLAARNEARRGRAADQAKAGDKITVPYLSRMIGEAVGPDAITLTSSPTTSEMA